MVQVTGVPRTPEFMQLVENLVVVLVGAQRIFAGLLIDAPLDDGALGGIRTPDPQIRS